ncbi:SspB family protein [Jannaschia ovalis]|uniref:ClpXP protease specificity-enhancing factor SspB n=1 Tax=Jannaschia ovalis TaxID=3038773 RepID=A0ABY8LDQ6_9RHOB|nr:ClpXP protease specificity-enhancing factor SspB [Jannaschia sp. GRR-S6-38]WGH78420.1 ClpXP protease specificity-enhancing factor SspB [Jannaschia sp. GRR-S6-38]
MSDTPDTIDYGTMMHDAMRGLIARVLRRVARDGLPGEHHFFISFDTNHPGVQVADWLRERYPEDMTIVLQHWYEGLEVREDDFSVTLNFGDHPEPLIIPFDALRTFVDPSVEFGLRFERRDDDDLSEIDADALDGEAEAPFAEIDPDGDDDAKDGKGERREAEIVSLDRFRK